MKTKKVTIQLSETDCLELAQVAAACGWTLSKVVEQCVRGGMPPSLSKVPDVFHDELLALNQLDDRQLFSVIEGKMPSKVKQTELHKKADFVALRRTYAASLLRWRGHPVPVSMFG